MVDTTNVHTHLADLLDQGLKTQDALRRLPVPIVSKTADEFGVSTGNADNKDQLALAAAWLGAQTSPAQLTFNPGIYKYSESPNWAIDNATIVTNGVVRFRNTGIGNAFILDAGASSIVNGMRVGRFFIEGHDGSGDGVYIRAVNHSIFDFNVRGCGTTQAGMRMEFCVLDEVRLVVSVNEGGAWYNDGTGEAEPLYGLYIDARSGVQSAANTFINPILEGTGTGCQIEDGSANIFVGGAMEGCVTYGINVKGGCNDNKLLGTFFEANGTANCLIAGAETELHGAYSDDLVQFTSDGGFNASHSKIIGGSGDSIQIDSPVRGVKVHNTSYNRTGSGTFVDNGTDTQVWGLTDITNLRIMPGFRTATSITDNIAVQTPVGSVTDTQTALDGNEWNMPENNSTPAIDVEFNFQNIERIKGVVFNSRYVGSSSHYITVSIYDYTNTAWRDLMHFSTTPTNNYRTVVFPDGSDFIDGSGNAKVRFYHPTNGNTSHDLYVEYIALLSAYT